MTRSSLPPAAALCLLLAAAQIQTPARAQDKPAPKPDTPVSDTITVTAAPQAFKATLDRRSFSIANDLQKDSSSLADALRNIPSVEVDLQGNVSLRGDPSSRWKTLGVLGGILAGIPVYYLTVGRRGNPNILESNGRVS